MENEFKAGETVKVMGHEGIWIIEEVGRFIDPISWQPVPAVKLKDYGHAPYVAIWWLQKTSS